MKYIAIYQIQNSNSNDLVITSVSDPDPVGSGYFDRLGSGSGLNTRIPDPGSGSRIRIPTKILSKINLKFSYFLLKLIIGCVLNQPQMLKIFFTEWNQVRQALLPMNRHMTTAYSNEIDAQNFDRSGSYRKWAIIQYETLTKLQNHNKFLLLAV